MWKKTTKSIVIIIIIFALSHCAKGGADGVNTTPPDPRVLDGTWEFWPYMVRLVIKAGKLVTDEGETPVGMTTNTVGFYYRGKKHRGVLLNGDNSMAGFWGPYIDIAMGLVTFDFFRRLWKADRIPLEVAK